MLTMAAFGITSDKSPGFSIRGIPTVELAFTLPMIATEVERALSYSRGEMSVEDISERCKQNIMQLWIVMEENVGVAGVIVTELINYPNLRAASIIALAGDDIDKWLWLADEVIATWARSLKCDVLEAIGRAGWARKLTKVGWTQKYVFVGKEL